ncbi:Outer dense fiber protein 2 [Lemmus lemmus]
MCLPASHQNPPHCLEITPPSSEELVSVMQLSDLSTEDENSGHCALNRYDKKIDSLLLNAVGCLKSEVKLQKGECQMAKRFLEERKEELEEVAHELAESEHENAVLEHNIERIKEEKKLHHVREPGWATGPEEGSGGRSPGSACSVWWLQKKHLQQEKECLMSKLAEAEMDGAAAAKQVMALKDTVRKLKSIGGALGWEEEPVNPATQLSKCTGNTTEKELCSALTAPVPVKALNLSSSKQLPLPLKSQAFQKLPSCIHLILLGLDQLLFWVLFLHRKRMDQFTCHL